MRVKSGNGSPARTKPLKEKGGPDMTALLNEMGAGFPWQWHLAFFVRIAAASLCGAAVGFERSRRFKEAGIRTHCIVCCTAAVFMILSKYAFAALNGQRVSGYGEADPGRIAAQVVCSIGFLGAGVIFKNGSSIKGLTTAAGIWATSAIGMAIGAGLYYVGFFTTSLVVLLQILMHRFTVGSDAYSTNTVTIVAKDTDACRDWLLERFREWGVQATSSSAGRNSNGTITYRITLRVSARFDVQTLLAMFRDSGDILSVSFSGEQ